MENYPLGTGRRELPIRRQKSNNWETGNGCYYALLVYIVFKLALVSALLSSGFLPIV